MKPYKLNLVFKGERPYVQGATIWDEAARLLTQAGYMALHDSVFTIYRMTSSNLCLAIVPINHEFAEENSVARLQFTADDGSTVQADIFDESGTPSTRIPYDESLLWNHCEIDRENCSIVVQENSTNFTPIEIFVSTTKALHLAVLDKPKNTSWVFCRWACARWPLACNLTGVTIKLEQVLGTRLTRSCVMLDDKRLGYIDFSARVLP